MKIKINSIFLTAPLLLLLTQCRSAPQGSSEASHSPFQTQFLTPQLKVLKTQLPNGLKILLIEDHSSPTFAYQTWFRVGSRNEVKGQTGLAHFFEHMMFKETTHLKDGEFDRILENAGAEGENAFTSNDFTAYIQELPSKEFAKIVELEADRMTQLVVNESAFKIEREVVQNERRFRNENNADGLLEQALFETIFTQHPYHWPVIGYAEDLEKMTPEIAKEFYHRFYGPNTATVVVVGDVTPQQVIEKTQAFYGGLAPLKLKPPTTPQLEPEQKSVRRKNLILPIQVEKLTLGYPVPSNNHADSPALEVLEAVLANGKASRLYLALVDQGWSSDVSASDSNSIETSVLTITSNLQSKKGQQSNLNAVEKIILKEIERLTRTLVPETELNRVKNQLELGFYEGLESPFQMAYFLGLFETIAGSFEAGIKRHAATQALSAEAIRRAAQLYLQPQRRTVITGVPK